MNYLEFLTKKAEAAKTGKNEPSTETSEVKQNEGTSLFGEEVTEIKNDDGSSVFSLADEEQLQNIDYDKIVSKEQPEESNTLTSVLRDFFSFDAVKTEADTDGDGEISAQEAKDYVSKLAAKDGDATTLSMNDFDAVIKEKEIDLEVAFNQFTQQTETETQLPETSQPETEEQTSQISDDVSSSIPTDYSSNGSYSESITDRPSSGNSSYSYSEQSTPSNPLDSMSLEQLQSEKATREAKVKEKQADVNAVNNGTNAKVKAAKDEKDKAETAYKEAVKNDPNVKKGTDKDFEKNLENINKNQTKLDENAVKITDKEAEITNQEETIKSLTSEFETLNSEYESFNKQLSSLQDSLSKAGTPTGKEEDKDKDAQIKAKKEEINTKISEKNKEIKEKKKEIEAKDKEVKAANKKLETLKKDLEKLNTEKTKLEEEKTKLNEEKTAIEATIKETCTAETKAKMEAYNKAVKNIETVKASELSTAKAALTEAQEAVSEVNTKIAETKKSQALSKLSDTPIMDLSSIPESFRKKYGVTEKTLPDGTKVLACSWSRFNKCQKEWIELQQPMLRAASDLGLTLVYSDTERTVAESNAGRARKGALVCKGGESPHNYGVASDIVLFKDGKAVGVDSDLQTAFAQKAKEYSNNRIEWGGDWRKKGERHHFEVRGWQSKYKNPSNLVG